MKQYPQIGQQDILRIKEYVPFLVVSIPIAAKDRIARNRKRVGRIISGKKSLIKIKFDCD